LPVPLSGYALHGRFFGKKPADGHAAAPDRAPPASTPVDIPLARTAQSRQFRAPTDPGTAAPLDAVYAIPHTPSVTAPSLADLQDRAAIHDLVMRYARAVDRRDFAGVAACFTPDAAYQGQLSRTGIAEALARLEAGLARWDVTQHLMGNQLVELDGDRARCETYALASHVSGDGGARRELTVAVIYEDELVRTPDGWRIAGRVARTLFVRESPP